MSGASLFSVFFSLYIFCVWNTSGLLIYLWRVLFHHVKLYYVSKYFAFVRARGNIHMQFKKKSSELQKIRDITFPIPTVHILFDVWIHYSIWPVQSRGLLFWTTVCNIHQQDQSWRYIRLNSLFVYPSNHSLSICLWNVCLSALSTRQSVCQYDKIWAKSKDMAGKVGHDLL